MLVKKMDLTTPIEKIPRVGPQYQKKLKKLGIKTIRDLLFHFPHRYEDFSHLVPIAKLVFGQSACVQGRLIELKNNRTFRKRMVLTQAVVEDKTGAVRVVWFNQPYLINTLKKGDFVCLAGKVVLGDSGAYLSNPAYEKLPTTNYQLPTTKLVHTGRIVPVYPETEGLSSRWLRWILKPLLYQFRERLEETLPDKILTEHALLPLREALCYVHFPESLSLAERAKKRFSFEELFYIGLFVLRERAKLAEQRGMAIPLNLVIMQRFVQSLPFQLTDAQKKSVWQVLKDLEKPRPMNRLLEGDVGSGKTVVALMASLNVAKAGFQTAFMAPTELLAKQHFREAAKLLANFGLNIGLLTGKQDKFISKKLPREVIEISRQKLLEKARGKIDPQTKIFGVGVNLLIGTHALIQDKVKFGKLGLVILDEQHRFGVGQRAKLLIPTPLSPLPFGEGGLRTPLSPLPEGGGIKGGGDSSSQREGGLRGVGIPHLLSMTATPIPRTLALTIYGDLDLSLIDELPKGRKKIITQVVAPAERDKAYSFIRSQVKQGRQVFVICPRIEKSEIRNPEGEHPHTIAPGKLRGRSIPYGAGPKSETNYKLQTTNYKQFTSWAEVKAVEEEYEKLSQKVFPDLRIGMLHGRLATKEKEKIMRDFKNKKIDILVSTSVVEVGIDVPNASVMFIEGSERFGLAQLHQFRGRVGRAEHQSYCFLFTDSPARKTHQRLKALLSCENGFELAEKDLGIRGPGDFAGTRQWGIPDLAMASLKDIKLVEKTRKAAKEILLEDPGLKKYPLLTEKLKEFSERVHLE